MTFFFRFCVGLLLKKNKKLREDLKNCTFIQFYLLDETKQNKTKQNKTKKENKCSKLIILIKRIMTKIIVK